MRTGWIGRIVASGLVCTSALGQVPRPTFYVWTYKTPQETPATANTCVAPNLKPFALLDGYNSANTGLNSSGVLVDGLDQSPLDPDVAARPATNASLTTV